MSTKKKNIWKNRLTLELLGMCAAALLIAIAAANLARNIAVDWIYNVVYSDEKYEQDITDMLQSLQDYVQEEQVTEDNIKQLVNWVRKQKNVYVTFYRDIDELLGPFMANSGDEPYEVDTEYESMYYTINLYDGTPIKVQLEVYLDMNYMYWVDVAMYVTGGIVFLLLLLLMIHHKIRYINRLESELKILGGGNLEYPITIKGNDEITSLAEGITALKNGFLEEQQMKAEAEKANMELVTAMSHDLRTPLTSLIGYLELLNMHRYENEEQLQKYLEYCRKKAFQIKKVSDRLFEYFLVYGKEEKELQLQTIPSEEMAEDLCNGQFFDWQDRGGTIDCQIGELPEAVQVDSEYMQRVMDNLLSNLKKYGDPAYPLQIQIDEHQDMLHIRLKNHVLEQKNQIESTQIGLKTCRRIIENHGGTFAWRTDTQKNTFTIEMELPLAKG